MGVPDMWIKMRTMLAVIGAAAVLAAGAGFRAIEAKEISNKQQTVEARLQVLEDRQEIRQLLMNYGRFLDQRDFASFSQLFAEQGGEWIGGMGRAKGPQAIRKLMEDTIGKDASMPKSANFHLFTNEIIDVKGDKAAGTAKWIFVVRGEGNRPQFVFLGHYEDSFIRENGRWKFLQRTVYADIPTDNQMERK
jgi:hypothetical protein